MLQATIVSVVTFAVIYYASRALGLERRLGACLGAGGAICGVSGAIAMAGAVKATKEQVAVAITLVILWAIVMIFVLPFAAKAFQLHAAIAGAWIGIWAFIFALIATTRWEVEETGGRPSPAEVWWRFPKFVVGFLIASALVTLIAAGYSFDEYKKSWSRTSSRPSKICAPGPSSFASCRSG